MPRPPILVALTLLGALPLVGALATDGTVLGQRSSQTSLSVEAGLSPVKAGTEAAPRASRLSVEMRLSTPDGLEKPVVIGAIVLLPRGVAYNGDLYPACRWGVLNAEGPARCPRRSIMGRGIGSADVDGVSSRLRMKIVNGGASRVYGYVTLAGPAKVSAAVPVLIKRLRHRKWQHRLTVTMPRALQTVAGMPIALQVLDLDAGKGAKGSRHRGSWLATTRCPRSRRHHFLVTALLESGAKLRQRGSMRCR